MQLKTDYGDKFGLIHDMLATPQVIRDIEIDGIVDYPVPTDRVFVSGEASSRMFPGKLLRRRSLSEPFRIGVHVEGAAQLRRYPLDGTTVFIASNSGRTAECVRLLEHIDDAHLVTTVGVTAYEDSPVAKKADWTYVLRCGPESAVAATKAVVEQALFYEVLFRAKEGVPQPDVAELADAVEEVLHSEIPDETVSETAAVPTIYFAGPNDGVGEELALKANEIARKRSVFLEGTYAVHGVEEVMSPQEMIVLIEPFEEVEDKFEQVFRSELGMKVLSIATRPTRFPTLQIPNLDAMSPYLALVAGWKLLAAAGIAAGLDVDHPKRARKVGYAAGNA